MKRTILLVPCVLALSACAIQQTVKPVESVRASEICVIQNNSVRAGFLESYRRALESKGHVVRVLPPAAAINDCPMTSTYTASWRWDLALYMAYAEIKVYSDGKPAGEVKYDAQGGGMNTAKFIDAAKKITDLVDQLFPHRAGG